jgi:hypothetical protein
MQMMKAPHLTDLLTLRQMSCFETVLFTVTDFGEPASLQKPIVP